MVCHLTEEELRDKQRADSDLRAVIQHLESGDKPSPSLRQELPDLALWLQEWKQLELRDGVLYRTQQENGQVMHQLALPVELRATVLRSLHDDLGYLGIERTLDLARSLFCWPRMSADVEQKIRVCVKRPHLREQPPC